MNDARMIPLDCINDTDRLRPLDGDWVAALAESIREHGLEQPIVVRPNPLDSTGQHMVLVAGGHRLAAYRLLELPEISAIVREIDKDQARLIEIDENLMRRELSPLDRAVFVSERKAVWERIHPDTAHGGDRKSRKKQGENQVANIATRFSKDVAAKVGLSERSIQLACRIASELGPDAIASLRGTPLAENQSQLIALSRMEPAARAQAIEAAVRSNTKTVSAAMRSIGLGGSDRNPDDVMFAKLSDLWARSSAKVRRRFLAHIGMSGEQDSAERAA